jgi:hypothetical protein
MSLRHRLNDWAYESERQGPPTPKWFLWMIATRPRTAILALVGGLYGLVRTLMDPNHWGSSDDVGAVIGGVLGVLLLRYFVLRRERIRSEPPRG